MLDCRTKLELIVKGVKGDLKTYRKGGGGPIGGVGFKVSGSVVSAPYRQSYAKFSPFRIENAGGKLRLFKGDEEIGIVEVPKAEYYHEKTSFGVEAGKIVALDGVDSLVTSVSRRCTLWRKGLRCRFCSIEHNLKSSVAEKTPEMIAEAVKIAYEEDRNRHLTITSGLGEGRDKGATRIAEVVKAVKSEVNIPVHVQVEAVSREHLEILHSAGADSVGIHAEVLDEKVRPQIVPGKSPLEDYFRSWSHAVEVFGEWNVNTWIILGFGEDVDKTVERIGEIVEIGVTPFVAPYRPPPFSGDRPPSFEHVVLVYERLKDVLPKIPVRKVKSGCFKCGGCSAIKELIESS